MTTQRTKRVRKPSGRAMLSRSGLLTGWDGFVSVYAEQRRGERSRDSLLTLTLHGDFTQPVRGVSAFDLRLSPEDEPGVGNVEIPCIGVWIATKPTFDGGVQLLDREFKLILAMAKSGQLTSLHVSFQEPHYGKSLIASASFSSDPPEEG